MPFTIEKTRFDFIQNTLLINHKEIDLPEKNRQALYLFLSSENKIISKESLMKELWEDLIVSDNSLFKIIQNLRVLFKENGLVDDVIVNVYGKGYKVKPAIVIVDTKSDIEKDEASNNSKTTVIKLPLLNRKVKITFVALIVLTLFIAVSLFYLNSATEHSVFTSDKYSQLIQEIQITPRKSLSQLNENYNQEKLNQSDQVSYFYLKALGYFHQGNYKTSIESLNNAVLLSSNEQTIATADSFTLLAMIHLYRSDAESMLTNINKAEQIYVDLNYSEGMLEAISIRGHYLIMTHQYTQAIALLTDLLSKAVGQDKPVFQIKAHIFMSESYAELNNTAFKKQHIEKALKIALKVSNGKYIAYCYGTMAVDSMKNGDFIKAMHWAGETLKYAVVQPSTNNFQQGFSYLYNILSALGHDQLAEKYLQKAIDLQNHFNSDGHLHIAEINLGILKVKLGKYKQAKLIFSTLLTYNLSHVQKHEALSWLALTHYYLKDNISAYTVAKDLYSRTNINDKSKLMAGVALVFSAIELERINEANKIHQDITLLLNENWLIEYAYYLKMAIELSEYNPMINTEEMLFKQQKLNDRIASIKHKTHPDTETLIELDNYLDKILTTKLIEMGS